jgi:D-ribulokinase
VAAERHAAAPTLGGGIAIGLDVGTSGVRAALVDAAGVALALGAAPLDRGRRVDPEAWWVAVEGALDTLRGEAGFAAVRAIAVDGTSGTLLAVDAAGRPLGPARMYNEPAASCALRAVRDAAPPDSAALGPASPLAKALDLQVLPGAARLLHQADWVAGRFLGRFDRTDESNALKTGYDPAARRWPDWLARAGLRTELLPAAAECGAPLGEVTPAAARRFGLPPGVVVAAGTTDGCASFLASGARAPGEGVTALGSSMALKLACDRPLTAPEFGVYSHRLGGIWLAGGASNSGGAALARHFDAASLARLSARIDPSRPSGLDYYPLPSAGERFPRADAALAPRETPRPADDAAFPHGLLEGIARIEALGYRRLAELGAPALRSVRGVGGGARNAVWGAIRARVLGVPLVPAASEEAAVGAAALALRALEPAAG